MKKAHILVVDDETDIIETVRDILNDEGYEVTIAKHADQANQALKKNTFNLILLDIWMPGVDGVSLLKQWVTEGVRTPVVMMSGHGTVETAVEATKLGAIDYLEKPISLAKLLVTVERALKEKPAVNKQHALIELPVGRSQMMADLKQTADRIAKSNANVLIFGEVGSGKRAFANYIHQQSAYGDQDLLNIGSAKIIQSNADIELFGSDLEQPAFIGLLEKAANTTLVFDEVSSLSLPVQEKLLATLENRRFLRVGGTQEIEFNGRIIVLTQMDLEQQIKQGLFREDLYYLLSETRLNTVKLVSHLEDLPEVLNYYVDWFCQQQGLSYRKVPLEVQNYLINFPWTGNLAQVKNLVKQLLILGEGDVSIDEVKELLLTQHFTQDDDQMDSVLFDLDIPLKAARDKFDKYYFQHHLKAQNYNLSQVAKIASVERTTLYRRLKQLGIKSK